MNYLPTATRVAAQVRPADRWISRIAAATVAGLAGVAGALSYSHMRQLAQGHGQGGWHAHAFPLSVDGVEIVASLVLLADRRAGRRSGWLPWTALAAGAAGSLAANIATAHPDPVSRIIAGWPALALLLAVKLLAGLLERPNAPDAPDHPTQATGQTAPSTPTRGKMLSSPGEPPAETHPAERRPRPADPQYQQAPPPLTTADTTADTRTATLLPAARAARDALRQDGKALTRDTLAARLRQHGHPIRNASVTPLLHQLRREPTQPAV
jgi:hypothetical protein